MFLRLGEYVFKKDIFMKEDSNFDCEIKSFPFVLLITIEIICPTCFSDMIKSLKSYLLKLH